MEVVKNLNSQSNRKSTYVYYGYKFLQGLRISNISDTCSENDVWPSIAMHVTERRYGNIKREEIAVQNSVIHSMKKNFTEFIGTQPPDGAGLYKLFLEWSNLNPSTKYTIESLKKRKPTETMSPENTIESYCVKRKY